MRERNLNPPSPPIAAVPQMPRQTPPLRESRTLLVLRRSDQVVVAACVALGLLCMATYWATHALNRDRLIEIDRADRRSAQFVVDVNSAAWPELSQVPEIGETLARRIVTSRETQGPYRDLNELRRVPGIGPRTLERMKPHLLPMPNRESVAGP